MITGILGGASRAIIARGGSILASFALTVVVARLLGVDDAGWYFLVSTTLVMLATIGRFGTDLLALRICGGDTPDMRGELRSSAALALAASAAAALIAGLVIQFSGLEIPGITANMLWLVLSAVVPQAFAVLSGAILRARGWLALGVIADLGSVPVVTVLGLLGLEAIGVMDLTGALVALVVASWVTAAWSVPLAIAKLAGDASDTPVKFTDFLARRFRSLAFMMGASLLYFVLTWIPIYVLSIVSTVSAVSYYSVGARLANLMSLVPSIQVSYLAPDFALLFHTGRIADLNALCARAVRQAASILAVPAIVLCIGATPLVVLLYGSDFAPAGLPLTILAVGALLVTMLGQVNQLMLLCDLEGWTLSLNIVMVITWLLLGTWFAAVAGEVGAAWVSAATSVASAAIGAALLQRKRGIRSYLWVNRNTDGTSAAR